MKYVTLILLIIPLFIFSRIILILFKRFNKFRRRHVTSIKHWSKNSQFNKSSCIYKMNKQIARNLFDGFSTAIFIFLSVANNIIPDLSRSFINNHSSIKYIIVIWFLYYLERGCQWIRDSSKEFNSKRFTMLLIILTFISVLPMMLTFLLTINTDFIYVIFAILFFFFPLYYSTMSMLDIVEHPLLRNLFGYIFSILIAIYTALAIGIYNFYIVGTTENLSTYTDIAKMIVKGIVYLSQNSLKDIVMTGEDVNLDRVMQFLIAGYGVLVIAHIKKVASGAKEKSDTKK